MPTGIWHRVSQKGYAIILLGFHHLAYRHVALIDQMLPRRDFLVHQIFLDDRESVIVGLGGRGRFCLDNEVRCIFLTGFGEMRFVAHPVLAAFFTLARFRIIRGRGPDFLRGQIVRPPPGNILSLLVIFLDPYSAEHLDRLILPHGLWTFVCIHPLKQLTPIFPNLLS